MLFVACHCLAKRSKTSEVLLTSQEFFCVFMSLPLFGRQNFEIDQQNLSLFLLNVFSYASPGFCKYVYVSSFEYVAWFFFQSSLHKNLIPRACRIHGSS